MYTVAGATRLPDLDKPDLPPMSRPGLLEYGPQLDLKRQMAFGEGPVHVARAVGVDTTGGLYVAGEFYDRIELGGVKLSGIGLHVYVARFSPDWR